jgi:RNA polymerase sigma-70 factor, ECF subfamily
MTNGAAIHTWSAALSAPRQRTVRVAAPDTESTGGGAAFAGLDDSGLVAACRDGHKEAFDVIVERHRRSVYQICYRFVGNHEDASDLSQEVFLRAWRGLKAFKGQARLSTWLYRIAVNACLNRVSQNKPDTQALESEDLVDARTEDPRATLLRAERAVAVRRAIAQLPDKQRATLILRAYHELPHQEIAEILGSSVGATKANFFHALANLKKILRSEP